MEKLIELLNEYAHTYADHYDDTGEEIVIEFLSHNDQCFLYLEDGKYDTLVDDVIISKRFGFIQWLVDNDKIDLLQLDNRIALSEFNKVERVLMALSIQDSPIDFLCEILK